MQFGFAPTRRLPPLRERRAGKLDTGLEATNYIKNSRPAFQNTVGFQSSGTQIWISCEDRIESLFWTLVLPPSHRQVCPDSPVSKSQPGGLYCSISYPKPSGGPDGVYPEEKGSFGVGVTSWKADICVYFSLSSRLGLCLLSPSFSSLALILGSFPSRPSSTPKRMEELGTRANQSSVNVRNWIEGCVLGCRIVKRVCHWGLAIFHI